MVGPALGSTETAPTARDRIGAPLRDAIGGRKVAGLGARRVCRTMAKAGRRAGGYSQAARVVKLLDYLAGRRSGATYGEIAERFAVSERQARRDIAAIEEAGYFCEPVRVRGATGVRLIEGRPGAVRLTLRERYTLLAVRRVFDVLQGTPFAEDVRTIFDKVVASLPGTDDSDPLDDRFVYLPDGGTKRYDASGDILNALLTGVLRRQQVACAYRSARGHEREGVLDPYAVVLYRHGVYVVGALDDDSGVRVYAAERFVAAQWLRGQPFERPADFDIDRYFEGAFGVFTGAERHRVVVDLSPEVAHLVEHRMWHPSQKVTATEGGWLRLEMHVSSLTQVAHWLVGWGRHVRVQEPAGLAEQVRTTHEEAAR